jgi:hypothetical protein
MTRRRRSRGTSFEGRGEEWGAGGPPNRPPVATNPARIPPESSGRQIPHPW